MLIDRFQRIVPRIANTAQRTRLFRCAADIWEKRVIDREIATIEASSSLKGLLSLSVSKYKRSETLFVLGSGGSIEELSAAQWRHVAAHDSIGFNFWLVHRYVPTYFMFEAAPSYALDRNDVMERLLAARAVDYRNVPIINNYRHWTHLHRSVSQYPMEIRNHLYLHAPYYFPVVGSQPLRACLRLWRLFLVSAGGLIHHGSTLSSAIVFGVVAGYRRIVTLGVDLNNSEYFWERSPEAYTDVETPRNVQSGGVHQTASRSHRDRKSFMPIDAYLRILADEVLRPAGVSLFVGSPNSMLANHFPVYAADGHWS